MTLCVFNTLLRRVRSRRPGPEPVTFVAFDVLEIDGIDTTQLPLDERRARLRSIVKSEDPRLVLSRVFDDGAGFCRVKGRPS
jgi:ATP-dependent DNA ligase